ncbi:uncharacterized protein MONBRDRAFT_35954 [Monosiga brevicollis MX1]|uniref:Zinc finger CCCH-type with G patch domain-containing protein n=1 Tax=Monosiga brevicollis TaxID=81824 RepID=A9USU2_MONBE|nr:uncharacterized protein MONBRDRAFT_35954 [Monosiga brevicollis MX1]EDQ92163.1 predicted protein [Monosiga brevicollis MX1]|eukprot:XP_001743449.1 hypothetical protein [Monosiga brevicollis MX1]
MDLAEAEATLQSLEEALQIGGPNPELEAMRQDLHDLVQLLRSEQASSSAPSTDKAQSQQPPAQAQSSLSGNQNPVSNAPPQTSKDQAYASFFATEEARVATVTADTRAHRPAYRETIAPGSECMAPFTTKQGERAHHLARVLFLETDGQNCLVDFQRPLSADMCTCPAFLQGHCRFDTGCSWSHGHRVSVDALKPAAEQPLEINALCLVRSGPRLWRRALLRGVADDGQALVSWVTPLGVASGSTDVIAVSSDHLAPMCAEAETLSDDDDSDGDSDDDAEEDTVTTTARIDVKTFGAWERHTSGIGLKLLQKYGYKPGDGLGADKRGRVEPVAALVVPAGKSLDKIMQLRAQGRLHFVGEPPAKKHGARRTNKPTVFDKLNRILAEPAPTERSGTPMAQTNSSRGPSTKPSGPPPTAQAQLLGLEAQIAELERFKQRQSGRDSQSRRVTDAVHGYISGADAEIATLQAAKHKLEKEIKRKKSRDTRRLF